MHYSSHDTQSRDATIAVSIPLPAGMVAPHPTWIAAPLSPPASPPHVSPSPCHGKQWHVIIVLRVLIGGCGDGSLSKRVYWPGRQRLWAQLLWPPGAGGPWPQGVGRAVVGRTLPAVFVFVVGGPIRPVCVSCGIPCLTPSTQMTVGTRIAIIYRARQSKGAITCVLGVNHGIPQETQTGRMGSPTKTKTEGRVPRSPSTPRCPILAHHSQSSRAHNRWRPGQ
jgi:hypothetical protein